MPNNPFHALLRTLNIKLLNDRSYNIKLVTVRDESLHGNFVYPGIDTVARIEIGGQCVGDVDFGINPLGDRLYIKTIEIRAGYRFRGVGLGTLWRLWQTHQVPIVPLLQGAYSKPFWVKARRRFAAAGAVIEADLEISDLEEAKQRWAHLIPALPCGQDIHELKTPYGRPHLKAEIFEVGCSPKPE